MTSRSVGRLGLAGIWLLGSLCVLAAALAGGATDGAFHDTEPDDAGTIRIVKANDANVQYKKCTFLKVRPSDPNAFTLEVTTVDGQSATFDESDFSVSGSGQFNFKTKDHFQGKPNVDTAVLDGTSYPSPGHC